MLQESDTAMEMKCTDGLKLFKDLTEGRITYTDFLCKFWELPQVEQDRLLQSKPANAKTAAA
jgi:hypothetical protein